MTYKMRINAGKWCRMKGRNAAFAAGKDGYLPLKGKGSGCFMVNFVKKSLITPCHLFDLKAGNGVK